MFTQTDFYFIKVFLDIVYYLIFMLNKFLRIEVILYTEYYLKNLCLLIILIRLYFDINFYTVSVG